MSGAMAPRQKVARGRPLVGFPNTDPVVTITFAKSPVTVSVPQASGEYTATAVDAEQGDIASSLVWTTLTVPAGEGFQVVNVGGGEGGGNSTGLAPDTAGFADATNGSLLGAQVTAAGAATYDFDVTIDGGGLQQLSITTSGGETYTALAALMSAAVTGGTVAYNDPAFAFRVTSSTTGASSAATIAVGTLGSGGGDLFAALDAAETVTHTFPAPTAGTSTTYTASVSINGGEGQAISIVGDDAQTYTELLAELEADTITSEWTITGGNVRCTSDTSGAVSSVSITDTDLFSSLTEFVSILAAVPGTDAVFGTIGTGPSPAGMTFPLVGAQTVTATATDAFGATGDDTAGVTVDP